MKILKKLLLIVLILTSTTLFANTSNLFSAGVPSLAPMLENVTPAVVNIYTIREAEEKNQYIDDPFLRKFFNIPGQQQSKKKNRAGLGSGVIIDSKKGYIITNNHVIAKAKDIKVKLQDGREFKASLVGTDPASDIAIIKITPDNLQSLKFANSEKSRVGDFVVAIGNPFGIGQTVTSGIISALGRSGLGIEAYENFIQTDASINPGNSGGALVNLKGEIVGINTAIIGSRGSSGSVGIGLAIPINMALDITDQLIKYGKVKRGYLGVAAQDLTKDLSKAFGINTEKGAIVTQVQKNSPADKAGIQIGDVITKLNNKKIENAASMRNKIGLLKINTNILMEVNRKGKILKIKVKIVEPKISDKTGIKINPRLQGMVFSEILENMPEYGKISGIKVTKIKKDSPAYSVGIRVNDIILSINNIPVQKIKDLEIIAGKNDSGIVLHVQRKNRTAFLLIN
ncbi:MAG: Do family serine endopeptidase [Gammaproteobacteria bacterium]|jgi:Do/DeqQ family serine protease|nr:Do family serine endopeptidase [Gammaproteobacteria bacterium]MBT7603828.1 Do family serine endopeptidase [Gammaproteobacteria bacterium]